MPLPPPPAIVADTDSTRRAAPAAQDPRAVQPERPTVATHAGTVAPGYAELETGGERDVSGDGSRAFSIPTVLKLGAAPRVQINVTLPTTAATGVGFGLGDVAAGVKWRLTEGAPVIADFALLPQLKFATGGARGTGTTDATLLAISSRTLGPVSLDLNLGITRRSGDGTGAPRTATLWTASFGLPVRGALGWAFECYGYPGTSGPAGAPPVVAILTGPTFAVRAPLALDLGTIIPVEGGQPHALYAGAVVNFGRAFGRER